MIPNKLRPKTRQKSSRSLDLMIHSCGLPNLAEPPSTEKEHLGKRCETCGASPRPFACSGFLPAKQCWLGLSLVFDLSGSDPF